MLSVCHCDSRPKSVTSVKDVLLTKHICVQRAVQKVMQRNMGNIPLQIVFNLFDANQDGNLASTELVTVSNIQHAC